VLPAHMSWIVSFLLSSTREDVKFTSVRNYCCAGYARPPCCAVAQGWGFGRDYSLARSRTVAFVLGNVLDEVIVSIKLTYLAPRASLRMASREINNCRNAVGVWCSDGGAEAAQAVRATPGRRKGKAIM